MGHATACRFFRNELLASVSAPWPYNTTMHVVTVNPKIQGGLPCFAETRVPVTSLFDHLKRGYTVEQFLEDFPTAGKEQVDAVLEMAKSDVPNHAEHVTS